MATSKKRKAFRYGLALMFILSFTFFGMSAYFYMAVKTKAVPIKTISPALFQIDIYHHLAWTLIRDKQGQYEIGKELIRKGIFDVSYNLEGKRLIKDLAQDDHAPSQVLHADILMAHYATTAEREKALSYYERAALSGYEPAFERLAKLSTSQK